MYHFIHYLVEISQWESGRDRKHPWCTIQHLEQLRSHQREIINFRYYDVTFGHVTSGNHAIFGHEQCYILYYYYSKKKRRGYTSGHAQDILPVMTSLHSGQGRFRWRHFQQRMRNGPLPFAPPELCLELSQYTTLIFGFGGKPYKLPMKNISRTAKFLPIFG
jgi:hypothetical protein